MALGGGRDGCRTYGYAHSLRLRRFQRQVEDQSWPCHVTQLGNMTASTSSRRMQKARVYAVRPSCRRVPPDFGIRKDIDDAATHSTCRYTTGTKYVGVVCRISLFIFDMFTSYYRSCAAVILQVTTVAARQSFSHDWLTTGWLLRSLLGHS
jgi:hypothetical protein